MRFNKHMDHIFHSLFTKIAILVLIMAITVITSVALYHEIIFESNRTHHLFLLITILVIIFTSSGFFFHRLVKPIEKLSNGVKEISKGNLDVKLNIGGTDEIGKLAEAFNQMTVDLKRMIETRDQLLLDVSHELRTPLTRAKLALEMTEKNEFVDIANKNINEVETMITELLESQRLRNNLDKLELSSINLHQLLRGVEAEYELYKNRLIINPVSEKLHILGDEKLIKIVLRNIIDNGIKYSPENVPPIEISVIDSTENITIQIEDFGNGLAQQELDKVFEPFYRTDRSRNRKTGGYGLGLHLCKRIMDAHNGEIILSNKKQVKGLIAVLHFRK